jgi:predicted dinucleotide-binding enzyme
VFLCSDDPQAKAPVKILAEQLGFVGIDGGDLERARLVESIADFLRAQIIEHDRGTMATISLAVLSGNRDARAT